MTRPICLEAASTVMCRPVTCMYVSLKVELASWHVTFAHEHLDNVKPSRPEGPWRLVEINYRSCAVARLFFMFSTLVCHCIEVVNNHYIA